MSNGEEGIGDGEEVTCRCKAFGVFVSEPKPSFCPKTFRLFSIDFCSILWYDYYV